MDRQRFATLEAMRGAAALSVVLMHGGRVFGVASPAGGYLAVDFFFLLSGFIMAHVYGQPLADGLRPLAFLRARVIRLYPLYLAGTVATALLAASLIAIGHKDALWVATKPFASLPFALFMLPCPATDILFPLDAPAWSLFLELVANVAFGFGAWRSRSALLATVGTSALALAASAALYGKLDLGWDGATALAGLARVLFSFPLGMMLYGLRHRIRLPPAFGLVPVAVLAALLYASPSGAIRPAFDLLFVFVASPLLLLAAASAEPVGRGVLPVCLFLGTISYPLYVLHHPALILTLNTIERHVPRGLPLTAAYVALLLTLALAARGAAALDRRVRLAIPA